MSTRKSRFRFVLKLWLLVSVVGFVWNVLPVLARFRAEQQRVARLGLQQQQTPVPVIDQPEDSPRPDSTIRMTAMTVTGAEESGPIMALAVGQQRKLIIASNRVSVIDVLTGQTVQSWPATNDKERIYSAAISGDGRVLMTAGEYTQFRFRDMASGRLLQTVLDNHPTRATQPDKSSRVGKHANGLRYSDTGMRLVAAAPNGCLFAVGKIDGTVELWAPKNRDLSAYSQKDVSPDSTQRSNVIHPVPESFHMLSRSQPHVGRVMDLSFTLNGRSLISVSGVTFKEMQQLHANSSIPHAMAIAYESDSHPRLVQTAVPTGESKWSVDLPDLPVKLAMDSYSQDSERLTHPPRGAVVMNNNDLQVFNLENGKKRLSFSASINNRRTQISAIAFTDDGSCLWTAETQYVNRTDQKSLGSVTAWDVQRGQRIATAEIPGQIMSAAWDLHGTMLVTSTWNHQLSTSRAKSETTLLPWRHTSVSPFSLHIWDTEIEPRLPPEAEKKDTLP